MSRRPDSHNDAYWMILVDVAITVTVSQEYWLVGMSFSNRVNDSNDINCSEFSFQYHMSIDLQLSSSCSFTFTRNSFQMRSFHALSLNLSKFLRISLNVSECLWLIEKYFFSNWSWNSFASTNFIDFSTNQWNLFASYYHSYT